VYNLFVIFAFPAAKQAAEPDIWSGMMKAVGKDEHIIGECENDSPSN
jgi:hypothetical protein